MNEQRPNSYELLVQQVQATRALNTGVEELQAQSRQIIDLLEKAHHYRVKVIDADIPFWNLVGLMLKVALAAVPAGLVLAVLGWLAVLLLGSGCAALLQGM